MRGANSRLGFLGNRPAQILSLLLIAQALVFYTARRAESAPPARPLSETPSQFGGWAMVREIAIEKEVQDVLRADDTMTRLYARGGTGQVASLFVAYFRSQRAGQAPHSPKNCLPGAGWVPSASERLSIPIEGVAAPIEVNQYIVSRGDEKSLVLYWYQTPYRSIASEYEAKFFLVVDSIRYNRSDTALVRVVVPVFNDDEEGATLAAVDFAQSFFQPLRQHLAF